MLKRAIGASQGKAISFRRVLVVFQFVIAQALIIATLVVASQMDYFRTADMGFTKEAIVYANFPNDSISIRKMDALRNALQQVPGIERVSLSRDPATGVGFFTDLQTAANHTSKADIVVGVNAADTGFFRLYHLPLVAGRIYYSSDTSREYLVSETLVRKLGIAHAQDAIGKMIRVNDSLRPIVGVLKDFHVNSLRDPIDPVVLMTQKNAYGMANISISMRHAKPVLAAMSNTWNQYFPDYAFQYSFLDQDIAAFY